MAVNDFNKKNFTILKNYSQLTGHVIVMTH